MTTMPSRAQAGFTLLEVIVALALLSLLMSLVPTALKLARRGPLIAAQLERHAAIDAGIRFAAQTLAEATPIYQRGADGRLQIHFEGAADHIAFIAPIRFDANDNGLGRFDLRINTAGAGRQGLWVSWRPWRSPPRDPTSQPDESSLPAEQTRLLVPNATALNVRYFGVIQNRAQPEWATVWPRTDTLPKLVEVAFTTPAGARSRVVTLQLSLP